MKIRLRGPLSRPKAAEDCLDPATLRSDAAEQTLNELIKTLKHAMTEADKCLQEKFFAKEDVNKLVKARAWVVDQ